MKDAMYELSQKEKVQKIDTISKKSTR